jgi:D-inositol-3-phosphate glycosyltransferase
MRSLAVLSLHTSPLAQPGSGDSGGMNVYVRELVAALAQAGVRSEVYVRRWADDLPEVVDVEPGFRVVHVDAGPPDLTKEDLPEVVDEFTDGVARHMRRQGGPEAIHANYWLSGLAGHRLKHELSLPLVSTFHTLARVKAETGDPEPDRRVDAETEVIACSDAILANCADEVTQLVELYGADASRIEIVPPGVDHAFFSPGDRRGARAALGLGDHPVLLFVGRIQPLKGLTVAIGALAELSSRHPDAVLVAVGGQSGLGGSEEMAAAQALIARHGLQDRVRFVAPQPHHMLSTYYRAASRATRPNDSDRLGTMHTSAAR